MHILSKFFVGFSCTLFLFVISLIIVLAFKLIHLSVKDVSQTDAQPKQSRKRRKRKSSNQDKTPPAVVHSVEIDPTKIDKIYVKKSS